MTITADLVERLALSRERMRRALQGRQPGRSGEAAGAPAAGTSMPWLASLKSLPIAGIVIDALSGWWAQHPLRIAVVVGSSAAEALARPIAERSPLGLVLGSAVLGAAVVWSRPWRWLLKPALFAGLMPQLVKHALSRLPAHTAPLTASPAAWQTPPPTAPQLSADRSKNA